jgi:hypothetical protein
VVGAFPDGESALHLAAARLRHIAGTRWPTKRYLNMQLLHDAKLKPGFPRWIGSTGPKATETLAKRRTPSFTRRVRQAAAT